MGRSAPRIPGVGRSGTQLLSAWTLQRDEGKEGRAPGRTLPRSRGEWPEGHASRAGRGYSGLARLAAAFIPVVSNVDSRRKGSDKTAVKREGKPVTPGRRSWYGALRRHVARAARPWGKVFLARSLIHKSAVTREGNPFTPARRSWYGALRRHVARAAGRWGKVFLARALIRQRSPNGVPCTLESLEQPAPSPTW